MINKINDVRSAISANAYQAALALALTLPDICGQIEYPGVGGVGKRYVDWCNTYLDLSDAHFGFGFENAEPNGDMFYALRCAFLHSGNDDILSQSSAAKKLTISKFELRQPGGLNGYGFKYKEDANGEFTCILDMEYICDLICNAAEKYYNAASDKSVFDDHNCMLK